MHRLDPIPAVRRIETGRADCVAFEIVGHVTAADVENLFGLLEGAYALQDRIDVLVRLVDHDGVDWAGVSPDTLDLGKQLARQHIRRCAAVGKPDWTSYVHGFFKPETAVELRHFPDDQQDEAWTWIGGRS